MDTGRILRAAVAVAALAVCAGHALAEGVGFGRSQAPAMLEGAWEVSIRPYDCSTGQTVPGIVFYSYLTFIPGGTVIETTSNPFFQPGQRSPGHGFWERTGQDTYHSIIQAYIQFNSDVTQGGPAYVRGVQRIDQGIQVLDTSHWSSEATVTFFDTAGTVVPPTGCMRASGTRMQ